MSDCTCGQNWTDEYCSSHGRLAGQCRNCADLRRELAETRSRTEHSQLRSDLARVTVERDELLGWKQSAEIFESASDQLRAEVERLREALEYLQGATVGIVDSYDDEIECRGDEDCDHCVVMDALNDARAALARKGEK